VLTYKVTDLDPIRCATCGSRVGWSCSPDCESKGGFVITLPKSIGCPDCGVFLAMRPSSECVAQNCHSAARVGA